MGISWYEKNKGIYASSIDITIKTPRNVSLSPKKITIKMAKKRITSKDSRFGAKKWVSKPRRYFGAHMAASNDMPRSPSIP